jgi:hypothetical protein
MKQLFHIALFFVLFPIMGFGQDNIEVIKLDFCNPAANELAPYLYQNKLIYISDIKKEGIITYTSTEGKTFTDFYVVPNVGGTRWTAPAPFAPELITTHNEGPFTFDYERNRIYYTQNIFAFESKGNSLKDNNNLMIYMAPEVNGEFRRPTKAHREFDDNHNYICPSINPEGTLLFFSSDQPGGYGGFDLYVCRGNNGRWDSPVNLGESVNTPRDEIYPFAHISGRLYFASNGHGGKGRFDNFYTYYYNEAWASPIDAGDPFNSPRDDYGVYISDDLKTGFFSSNRDRSSFDIFHYVIKYPIFKDCKEVKENSFCFEFFEQGGASLDTMSFIYEWDLGDGTKVRAEQVDHCYDEPGTYFVQLNVIDAVTGEIMVNQSNYMLELEEINQVYINSVDTVYENEEIVFDGLETNLKNFEVDEFFWFMGDGSEPKPSFNYGHKFEKQGTYTVRLGVTSTMDERTQIHKACGSKNIVVLKR